jgi:hypothetical protein
MPGGAGKPKRSCKLCKMHKFMGNSKHAKKHSVCRQLESNKDYKDE